MYFCNGIFRLFFDWEVFADIALGNLFESESVVDVGCDMFDLVISDSLDFFL